MERVEERLAEMITENRPLTGEIHLMKKPESEDSDNEDDTNLNKILYYKPATRLSKNKTNSSRG